MTTEDGRASSSLITKSQDYTRDWREMMMSKEGQEMKSFASRDNFCGKEIGEEAKKEQVCRQDSQRKWLLESTSRSKPSSSKEWKFALNSQADRYSLWWCIKNLAFLGSFSSLLKVVVSDSLPLLFTLKSLSFAEFFGDRKTSSTFLPSILVFLCFRSKPKETINFRQSKVEIEKQVKKNRGQAMKEKEERDAA